jgi:hypothetical protein
MPEVGGASVGAVVDGTTGLVVEGVAVDEDVDVSPPFSVQAAATMAKTNRTMKTRFICLLLLCSI